MFIFGDIDQNCTNFMKFGHKMVYNDAFFVNIKKRKQLQFLKPILNESTENFAYSNINFYMVIVQKWS